MTNNERELAFKMFGGLVKTVLNDTLDKAITAVSDTMNDVKKSMVDDQDNTPKKPVTLTNDEFMMLFLKHYDEQGYVPKWNDETGKFENPLTQSQFEYFKKGWNANV